MSYFTQSEKLHCTLHYGFSGGITDIQCLIDALNSAGTRLEKLRLRVGYRHQQHFCQIVHYFHSSLLS
jgi:hypothetical protein